MNKSLSPPLSSESSRRNKQLRNQLQCSKSNEDTTERALAGIYKVKWLKILAELIEVQVASQLVMSQQRECLQALRENRRSSRSETKDSWSGGRLSIHICGMWVTIQQHEGLLWEKEIVPEAGAEETWFIVAFSFWTNDWPSLVLLPTYISYCKFVSVSTKPHLSKQEYD